MSEHEEVEEHLHHAREPFDKQVAGSMAIIAALLALVSVAGQHFATESLLDQQLASDQWAFYQAKDIRRYIAQSTHDSLGSIKGEGPVAAQYASDATKYRNQTTEIQEKARDFERERTKAGRMADRFHFGEVFLEIAIVLSSLAILTKRRPFFVGGVASAGIGCVLALTAFFL